MLDIIKKKVGKLLSNATGAPAPGMCAYCHVKPVNPGHPFCGKGCAATAAAVGWQTCLQPGAQMQLSLPAGTLGTLKEDRNYDPTSIHQYLYRMAESQFLRMLKNHGGSSTITQIDYYVDPQLEQAFMAKKQEKKNEVCPAGCHRPGAEPWPKPGWQRRLSLTCLPRRVRELLRTSRNSPLPPAARWTELPPRSHFFFVALYLLSCTS